MSSLLPDTLTLEELKDAVVESVTEIQDRVDADIEALSADSGAEDQTQAEAAEDVETATGGAVSAADYQAAGEPPSFPSTVAGVFAQILDDGKRELLTLAANDLNAFTRQSLARAQELMADVEALLTEIESEALKIQLAAAAGLLVPPERAEVQALRADTQAVRDESQNAVSDLRSGRARRDAARRQLGEALDFTDQSVRPVTDRRLEPMDAEDAYATSAPGAPGLTAQSQAAALAGQALTESTATLQSSVLDRVSYIAVCLALNQLSTQSQTRDRAERVFEKLKALITSIIDSLGGGFVNDLQAGMQELAADVVESISGSLQDKLDAFDTFLSTALPELPTFVALVSNIGDVPDDLPVLESIASQCGLKFESFCDMQGLLEAAKSLDAELGIVLPRPPALGRVRLLAQAPEASDIRPLTQLPDQEANLLLSQTVVPGASQVVARFPRAGVQQDISAPVPDLPGAVAAVGDGTLLVSGLSANISGLGSITLYPGPSQEVVRYSGFEAEGIDYRFTLIDEPVTVAVGAPVTVTGEQRDTFQDAFARDPAIGGGPGRLVLDDDGAYREELAYTGSSFDPATGDYTFDIDPGTPVTAVPEHRLTLLCRPHPVEKQILYKDTSTAGLLAVGRRFIVQGDEVYAALSGGAGIDTSFDFSDPGNGTFIVDDVEDYDSRASNVYRLCVGTETTGVEIDSLTTGPLGPGVPLRLRAPFYGGDQKRATLCRVPVTPTPKGSSRARVRLDQRQKDDLRVAGLGIGSTAAVEGRAILDGGGGTVRSTGTSSGASVALPNQTLVSAVPLVQGDEADMSAVIDVQSGTTMFTTAVVASDASAQTLTYTLPQRTGQARATVVTGDRDGYYSAGDPRALQGSGTRFREEFKVGDTVYVQDIGLRLITEIRDQELMIVDSDMVVGGGLKDVYIAAPDATRAFTLHRTPRETLDFRAVTNLDDTFYELVLDGQVTAYAHGLQEPELRTSVQTLPDESLGEFLALFDNPAETVRPRFDGVIIPPGTQTLRAVFEDPDLRGIPGDPLGLAVAGANRVEVAGTSLDVTPPNVETDGVFAFELDAPLNFALTDGDVIEVETTSVFDDLKTLFPDDSWSQPFDDALAQIAGLLRQLEARLCRLLSGRPVDLASTALAISTAAAAARLQLVPIRLLLSAMELGLPSSDTIARVLDTFTTAGMDAAAEALGAGDVVAVSKLTPSSSTREGNAREAITCYREQLKDPAIIRTVDNMIAQLAGRERDKELLADVNREYKDVAESKLQREKEAAENLSADASRITS